MSPADLANLPQHPVVQFVLRLFANPLFSRGVAELWKSPHKMHLLYAQLGLMVFMIFFRAWRFSKSTHWARRVWTSMWTFGLYWVFAGLVLPCVILGQPYYEVLSGALAVLTETAR